MHLPLSQNHLVAAFFERQFLARGEEIIWISRFCNSNGVYTLCGCRRCLVRVYVLYHSSLDVLESENMTIACQPCDSCSPISILSLFNFKSVCLAALTGVASGACLRHVRMPLLSSTLFCGEYAATEADQRGRVCKVVFA